MMAALFFRDTAKISALTGFWLITTGKYRIDNGEKEGFD